MSIEAEAAGRIADNGREEPLLETLAATAVRLAETINARDRLASKLYDAEYQVKRLAKQNAALLTALEGLVIETCEDCGGTGKRNAHRSPEDACRTCGGFGKTIRAGDPNEICEQVSERVLAERLAQITDVAGITAKAHLDGCRCPECDPDFNDQRNTDDDTGEYELSRGD